MALPAGAKLGPYAIPAPIGAGDVVLKVPAARFSERSEREARAITALNPPNICGIYDVGPDYLVMEYIDGAPPRVPLAPKSASPWCHMGCGLFYLLCSRRRKEAVQQLELAWYTQAVGVYVALQRPQRASPRWPKLSAMMNLPKETELS
jgi:hypothetical protein